MKKRIFTLLLTLGLLVGLMTVTGISASAADHEHCECGLTHSAAIGDHAENMQTYNPISNSNALKSAASNGGYYYLTQNIDYFNSTITLTRDLTICLHGHSLNIYGMSEAFHLNGGSLTIVDCMGSGIFHTGTTTAAVVCKATGSTFNMYGGTINAGEDLFRAYDGVINTNFNMYGGSIVGNGDKLIAVSSNTEGTVSCTFAQYGTSTISGFDKGIFTYKVTDVVKLKTMPNFTNIPVGFAVQASGFDSSKLQIDEHLDAPSNPLTVGLASGNDRRFTAGFSNITTDDYNKYFVAAEGFAIRKEEANNELYVEYGPYTITKDEPDPTQGSFELKVDNETVTGAKQYDYVTVEVSPQSGYAVDKITYKRTGASSPVIPVNNNNNRFQMPGYPITVSVSFKVPVASVSLSEDTVTLSEVGETKTLTAAVLPDTATYQTVTWQSSDPAVATVSNGIVTAVSDGEATITATADGVSDTCTVNVSLATAYDLWVAGVRFNENNPVIDSEDDPSISGSATLSAIGTGENGQPLYTLTLDNFSYAGEGTHYFDDSENRYYGVIAAQSNLTINLRGESTITYNGGEGYAGIAVMGVLTICDDPAASGTGELAVTGKRYGIAVSSHDFTVQNSVVKVTADGYALYGMDATNIEASTFIAQGGSSVYSNSLDESFFNPHFSNADVFVGEDESAAEAAGPVASLDNTTLYHYIKIVPKPVSVYINGWNNFGGNWCIYENNVRVKGWYLSGSAWYYFDRLTGLMVDDCIYEIDGEKYYFYDWGGMANATWVQRNDGWYYFFGDGAMAVSEWVQWKDKWYYCGADGIMLTGWHWDEVYHAWYYLNEDGSMAADTVTPDGYYVDASGKWVE